MFTLENIIDSKAGREIKRAIAVKMVSQGFLVKDICELLDVSKNSFFDFLNQQIFNFKKLEWYLEIPQII